MDFKSQICTSRKQSERLLKLGLKRATADMHLFYLCGKWNEGAAPFTEINGLIDKALPAWSLHRLLCLIPKEVNIDGFKFPLRSDVIMRLEDVDFMYERLIGIIERVIKEGYFNKEYLEEK